MSNTKEAAAMVFFEATESNTSEIELTTKQQNIQMKLEFPSFTDWEE